ncbi:MAG: hypothetical protein K0U98_11765 [Deltaproteobacteria bacterium]|nr:hypothetical protein [Deltaproteobacteria bacterium]
MKISTLTGVIPSLLGALFLAILSTFGDWIWEHFIPNGKMIHGVVHGAVIFAAIGLVLGWTAGNRSAVVRGISLQSLIGIGISASFYPLYRLVGGVSLFLTWAALWLLTGLLYRHLAGAPWSRFEALARGGAAALLSGLAFWSISGIWTDPSPTGPNYLFHLLSWFWAFLPGFGALYCRFENEPHLR